MQKSICVNNLTKIYRMYGKPQDRMKEVLGFTGKKYYEEHYALDDVSFSVSKGEIVGIVGRNGSGKSTVLKILTGVLSQTSGSVEIDGKISALLELGAGFNSEYTGLKNIYLNATMMKISREEIEKKIPDILAFADIGDYINQPVKTYSSGMFVRLAFAVAIHVNPDILIVDEALAVGDTRFQMKCLDKFIEFVDAGKTILFVSHDINTVKRFCSRAIWLEKGKLICDGDVDEVTDKYQDYLISDMSIEDYMNNQCDIGVKDNAEDTDVNFDNQAENILDCDECEDILKNIDIAMIDSLRTYNSDGKEIDTIEHGMRVRLKVGYYVRDDKVNNPLLGVAIRRIDNEYICGLNTKLDGYEIPWKYGYNEVELVYESFDLMGGEYYFDVGIFDHTGIANIDYKAMIKRFFVKMDYIAEGIVVLKHRWNVRR